VTVTCTPQAALTRKAKTQPINIAEDESSSEDPESDGSDDEAENISAEDDEDEDNNDESDEDSNEDNDGDEDDEGDESADDEHAEGAAESKPKSKKHSSDAKSVWQQPVILDKKELRKLQPEQPAIKARTVELKNQLDFKSQKATVEAFFSTECPSNLFLRHEKQAQAVSDAPELTTGKHNS